MKRLLLFVSMLVMVACAVTPPPVVTPPSVVAQSFPVSATIVQDGRQPIPGLQCQLTPDESSALPCVYDGIQVVATVPANREGWGGFLVVSAPDFAKVETRITFANGALHDENGKPFEIILKKSAVTGTESSWLRREGITFRTENGAVWQYRGATAFNLMRRECAGEDLEGWYNDPNGAVAKGANVLRVLGMFNGGLGRFIPSETPDYMGCLDRTIKRAQAHKVRLEFVVFADAQNVVKNTSDQKTWLQSIASVIDQWNVLGELVNEYPQNGVDPGAFSRPNTRILWSRGSGLGDGDPALPVWDYATHHNARVDEWPRRIECREYSNNGNSPMLGWPCAENEPYGVGENFIEGRRLGIESRDDMAQWGVVCAMLALGCTYHSDAGITVTPFGYVQSTLATAFFSSMLWVPADAQTWLYQRGERDGGDGINMMPMNHTDALALRTFCKGNGSVEYCVAVQPKPGWVAIPRNGWRIVAQPSRGLVKLER